MRSALAALLFLTPLAAAAAGRPNVVIVLADDLGARVERPPWSEVKKR